MGALSTKLHSVRLTGCPLVLESHGILKDHFLGLEKIMENSKGHGKSWKMMIMSWNFYNCTEKFCSCNVVLLAVLTGFSE